MGEFEAMTVALVKLVFIATIVERVLAFVFESEWFNQLYYWKARQVPDPENPDKTIRRSRASGVKALLALALAGSICFVFEFDILAVLFANPSNVPGTVPSPRPPEPFGMLVTSFVVAGGSAGAIAIFQGYLNISKEARDANIAARQAEAKSAKEIAEYKAQEARANAERAEAARDEVQARRLAAADVPPDVEEGPVM